MYRNFYITKKKFGNIVIIYKYTTLTHTARLTPTSIHPRTPSHTSTPTWFGDILSRRLSSAGAEVAAPALTGGLTASHTRAVVALVAVEAIVLVHGSRYIAVGSHWTVQRLP